MRLETNGFCRVELIVMNIECCTHAYSYPTEACSTELGCSATLEERNNYNRMQWSNLRSATFVVRFAHFTTIGSAPLSPVMQVLCGRRI